MTKKHSVTVTILPVVIASLLFSVASGLAQTNVIFPLVDTIWKYNQTNDLFTEAPNWTTVDYDDSGPSWQEGPALLSNDTGNGNISPMIRTRLNHPNTANPLYGGVNYHARFFRKRFTHSDPVAPHTLLRLNRRFDDGAIIWLNGIEIGRVNFSTANPPTFLMRSECYSCSTPANCTSGGDADCEEITIFPADALVQGENVIAVSVHQTGGASSDITFGTSLEVIPSRPVTILSNSEPADRFVLQNRSTTLRVYADASPAPTYQWFKDNGPITDATNSSFTIASMTQADEGQYYVTVSNPLGSVNSRVAVVTFTVDEQPPRVLFATGSPMFDRLNVHFDEAVFEPDAVDTFAYEVTRLDDNSVVNLLAPGVRNGDGKSVTLFFDPQFPLPPPGTQINVLVRAIRDLTELNTLEETNVTFTSLSDNGCGTALFEAYDTGGGNAVNILTGHSTFPNNPDFVTGLSAFDSVLAGGVYANNGREGYGARVRGVWVPPQSGDWVLYLRSDDAGELWLNPNGVDAAGKVLVAEQRGCCNTLGDVAISSQNRMVLNLVGGKAYYIEALYKEGTGGDYVQAGAALRGVTSVTAIPAEQLGRFSEAGAGGTISISQQPANQQAIAGTTATFRVGVNSQYGLPACYQWYRDDVEITGANGSFYSLNTTLADNGAVFKVRVSLVGGASEISTAATLTVIEDTTPPTLVSASTDARRATITITFSEPVDGATGTNIANYTIAGSTVTAATLSGSVVTLTVDPPVATCVTHTLNVQGVMDRFNNTMVPSSTTFSAPLTLIALDGTHIWAYDQSNTELGDAWYASAFDDTAWPTGAITFAFPAGEVIQAGYPVRTPLAAVIPTVYFRTHFNLPTGPSTVTNLQLQQILDDGGVFYLNGVELVRSRMPAGPVNTSTLANAGSPSDPPQILETYSVPAGALRSGDNVLAARVHQNATTSSDIVFAAGLVAFVSECRQDVTLSISRDGSGTITISASSGTIHRAPSVTGPWSPAGPGPIVINPSQQTSQEFFQVRP